MSFELLEFFLMTGCKFWIKWKWTLELNIFDRTIFDKLLIEGFLNLVNMTAFSSIGLVGTSVS